MLHYQSQKTENSPETRTNICAYKNMNPLELNFLRLLSCREATKAEKMNFLYIASP
jgi:hypothetical protein